MMGGGGGGDQRLTKVEGVDGVLAIFFSKIVMKRSCVFEECYTPEKCVLIFYQVNHPFLFICLFK